MEVLKGVVGELGISELVAGQYGEQVVYRATFVLDGKDKVRLQGSQRPGFREGDFVAVSGTPRGFGLSALAYVNLTTGEQGNVGKREALLGVVMFVGISIFWATGAVAFLAAAAGVWCLFSSTRIALATQALGGYSLNAAMHTDDNGRTRDGDAYPVGRSDAQHPQR